MIKKASLQPTAEDTWKIVYNPASKGMRYDQALQEAMKLEDAGDIEGACNLRYDAFQTLVELIPDDCETLLEWSDEASQSALYLISFSAIDHFLTCDFEMCAAMLEMMLELDPEDHLEASRRLAYCYVALDEWELFDEVANDISDKYADKGILKLWAGLRRSGQIDAGELIHFKKSFAEYYCEFIAAEHPVSAEYLADIEREKPSRGSLARELWLQTEHLWVRFPGFIEALKA